MPRKIFSRRIRQKSNQVQDNASGEILIRQDHAERAYCIKPIRLQKIKRIIISISGTHGHFENTLPQLRSKLHLGVFPRITSDRFMNHDKLPFTDDLNIVRLTCLDSDLITNSEIGRIH